MKKNFLKTVAVFAIFIVASLCFAGCLLGGDDGQKPTSVEIEGITIVGDLKTNYFLSDKLDLNNAKLKVFYSDDTNKQVDIYESMITDFSTSKVGDFFMTITYKDKSIQKSYSVKISPYANYELDSSSKLKDFRNGELEETPVSGNYLGTMVINTNEVTMTCNMINFNIVLTINFNFDYDYASDKITANGVIKIESDRNDEKTSYNFNAGDYYARVTFDGEKAVFKTNVSLSTNPSVTDYSEYTYVRV